MARGFRIRINGFTEAVNKLSRIKDSDLAAKGLREVLDGAMEITESKAAANIRGRLHQPWKSHELVLRGKQARVFDINPGDMLSAVERNVLVGRDRVFALTKIAFNKAPHSWFLEYGFVFRNGQRRGPEGFWRNAVDTTKTEVKEFVINGVARLYDEFEML